MASPFDPTTQDGVPLSDAAQPAGAVALSSAFLERLRSGEREAFLRFFETYRGPVFDFVLRFRPASADAAAVTSEVFITTYRRILLREGAVQPRPWLYQAALALCRERCGPAVDDGRLPRRPPTADARAGESAKVELGVRFERALQALPERQYVALLLCDLHHLRSEEVAVVLGMPAAAGAALLFQAREAFLNAFNALTADLGTASCRLAERVAASAVGRTLADDELRRLREHAAYCKPCRKTMRSWGAGPIGLGLFPAGTPLPKELDRAPVFAEVGGGRRVTRAAAGGAVLAGVGVAGGLGAVAAAAATLRRAVASRTAAYALAAACLVAVAGMAVYVSQRDIRLVPLPVTVPTGLLAPTSPPSYRPTVHAGRSGATARSVTPVSTRTPRTPPHPTIVSPRQTALVMTASVVVSGGGSTAGGNGSGGGTSTGGGTSHGGTSGGVTSGGEGGQSGAGTSSGGQSAKPIGGGGSGGQSAVGRRGDQFSGGLRAGLHTHHLKQHQPSRRHAGPHPWVRSRGKRGATDKTRAHSGDRGAAHGSGHSGDHSASASTTARSRHGTSPTSRHGTHHDTSRTLRHGGHHGGGSRGGGHKNHGH